MEINMNLIRCPYCGISEMIGNMTSPICANPKCEFYQVPVPVEYVEDLIAYRSALEIAIDALNKRQNMKPLFFTRDTQMKQWNSKSTDCFLFKTSRMI